MNKIYGLLFLLITIHTSGQSIKDDFPSIIENKRTDKHIQLKGTKILIALPTDYKYNKENARYYNNKLCIECQDINMSYSLVKSNFTKDKLESKVGAVDVFKNIKVNTYDALYYESSNKYSKNNNVVIMFGDDSFMVMIEGVYKASDNEGKEELKRIFSTITYEKSLDNNPLENANFSFDLAITNFKYVLTNNDFYVYSKDGNVFPSNSFIIGEKTDVLKDNAQSYAYELLKTEEINGINLNSKKITKAKIGDYVAYTLETGFQYKDKSGTFYLVVLVGGKSFIVFAGNALDDTDENLIKFKKTVESIKIK